MKASRTILTVQKVIQERDMTTQVHLVEEGDDDEGPMRLKEAELSLWVHSEMAISIGDQVELTLRRLTGPDEDDGGDDGQP